MAQTRPGTYVLYKDPGAGPSPWPGIVYADDFAPRDIQQNRPHGYFTLVLLLGDVLQFRWATTNQLCPFMTITESSTAPQSEEQRQAWDEAGQLKGAEAGLEYWRKEVNKQIGSETSQSLDQYSEFDPEELVGDEEEKDEQLAEAIRISLETHRRESTNLPTPSSSPPQRNWRRSPQGAITIDSDEDNLYASPPKKPCFSPKRVRPSRPRDDVTSSLPNTRKRTRDESPELDPSSQQTKYRPALSGLDQLLGRSSLSQRSTAPTSDAIEGDISECKDFVRVPVGPDRTILTFQKKHVWDKAYFQDSRSGTNHFILSEDGFWELRHPELTNIDIEDFRFVAEFLTDGEFGLRHPETSEQKKEAIAECASAWQTAEKLNMIDLLEHIAEKVGFLEWEHEDVLIMAIIVYRTQGPTFDAHKTMRDWISSYIAHHFWSYIKDAEIGDIFRKRLRKLPELERDVFVMRAKSLTTGAEPDEDEESDEEDLNHDGDL